MPRKNTERRRRPGAYHVYNRGRGGKLIFRDEHDRRVFLSLVGRFARMHARGVEVVAFCPMSTHFHLIVWQKTEGAMGPFMASLMAAYVQYFHARHGSSGPLFDGAYRARRLNTAKAFKWAVVYVHDNHRDGVAHPFSSHTAYVDAERRPPWLAAKAALRLFGGVDAYRAYVEAVTT